jgi:hypothetical protein
VGRLRWLWEWELSEEAQILFEIQLVPKDCDISVEELGGHLRGRTPLEGLQLRGHRALKRSQSDSCAIGKTTSDVHDGLDLAFHRMLVENSESRRVTHF